MCERIIRRLPIGVGGSWEQEAKEKRETVSQKGNAGLQERCQGMSSKEREAMLCVRYMETGEDFTWS